MITAGVVVLIVVLNSDELVYHNFGSMDACVRAARLTKDLAPEAQTWCTPYATEDDQ